jgi:hypothetical protein
MAADCHGSNPKQHKNSFMKMEPGLAFAGARNRTVELPNREFGT